MKDPLVFYRALDPQKGSWDGYGFFLQGASDFVAYVADAPSGASIDTPELVRAFWNGYLRDFPLKSDSDLARIEIADGINRMQDFLRKRGRADGALYQSTFSLVRKSGNSLYYVCIGDSPIFLLRNKTLYRLDSAETWNGALVFRAGEDLRERQQTGAIQFAGVDGVFLEAARVGALDLQNGDQILLTSDGISDSLQPGRLLALLQSGGEQLRNELERVPAQDDMTLVVIETEIPATQDFVAELREQIHAVKLENARLQRELSRIPALSTRVEAIEKRGLEKRREATPKAQAPETLRRPVGSKGAASRLPAWIALAFLAGLTAGLSLFLWVRSSAPETPATAAAAQSRQPQERERPAVNPPQIAPAEESIDCDYSVQSGDTLSKIAAANKVDVEDLVRWNPQLKGSGVLKIGQKLLVCQGGVEP